MYLKELKGYKAPPVVSLSQNRDGMFLIFCNSQAKDAHVGVVKTYSAPSTPNAPSLPSDLAGELSKYDATEPTLAESPKASTSAHEGEELAGGAKEFLAFLEKDLPKPVHHH